MSALIVNNVLSSSVQVTYKYLDTDELFGYDIEGTYEIDISDVRILQNETSLLEGRDAIQNAYNRPNITARIGADDYLNGRVSSYNFSEGSLVGSETVSITITESRRLDSYASSEFAKYIPNPHALETFSETYNFSRNGADYTSTRNISIKYAQEAGDQFLSNARTFLTNYYFANRPSLGYQEDGISENAKIDKNFRGLINESYNLLDLTVSLQETVESSVVDPSKHVSRKETHTLAVDESGFLNKTFNIELKSLRLDSENVLTSAMASIVDEKKSEEQAKFGSPFSISKAITKNGNTATLTIQFSTDPKKSQENIISYSGQEQKRERFIDFTLNIQFTSQGKNQIDKFNNSKQSWINEQPNYGDKIKRLFHPLQNFYEKSRSTNFQKSDGKISESVVFTTDDSYESSDDGLLKLKKRVSKNFQIQRIEKFLDIGDLKDQVVQSDLKTVGNATVTADAIVSQSAGVYKAKEILESKTEELNEMVDEDVIHITSDVVNLNLGEGTASRTLNYLFIKE